MGLFYLNSNMIYITKTFFLSDAFMADFSSPIHTKSSQLRKANLQYIIVGIYYLGYAKRNKQFWFFLKKNDRSPGRSL